MPLMHFIFILLLVVIIILRNFVTTAYLTDSWKLQKVQPNLSHFHLWNTSFVRSRVQCLLWCHGIYSRGCGYNKRTRKCEVYLDWGQSSNWIREEEMDYYVPKSVNLFSNGWVDMRRTGLSLRFALLVVNTEVTWLQASSNCEGLGANLYIMDTAVKRQGLIEEFTNQSVSRDYWLGLNDRDREGQWVWGNSEPVVAFWRPAEPSNFRGNQNCVTLETNDNFLMDDDFCDEAK